MNTPNSEIKTPRTDAKLLSVAQRTEPNYLPEMVYADFARQLEQELQQTACDKLAVIDQNQSLQLELQQAREELSSKVETHNFIHQGHIKQNAHLQSQLSQAKEELALLSDKYTRQEEKRVAEFEQLAQMKWDLGICSECNDSIHHHMDEPFYTCQGCGQSGEATVIPKLQRVLQQLSQCWECMRELAAVVDKQGFEGGINTGIALQLFNQLTQEQKEKV